MYPEDQLPRKASFVEGTFLNFEYILKGRSNKDSKF